MELAGASAGNTIHNTRREAELDWARGLAVVFMVLVHVKIELPGVPGAGLYAKWVEFVGSPFAAPVFMMLLGTGIVYSKSGIPPKLARRGVRLIIMNYTLNIIAFGIPSMIMFFKTNDHEYMAQALGFSLGTDILAFAGLALLFFAAIKKYQLNDFTLVMILCVISVLNFLVTVQTDNYFWGALSGLFWRSNENSYFPFLSWIAYPVAGYFFGKCLIQCADKKIFYRRLLAVSFLITVNFLQGAVKHGFFGIWNLYFGDEAYYFQDFIQYVLTGGICFTWISILYFVSSRRPPDFLSRTLERWSKNAELIFYVHWLILGWISILELLSPANSAANFLVGITLFVFCDVVCVIRERLKTKAQKKE
jgi:uncharacterized membrane protein